jgi:hypothetical protein
VFCDKIIFGCSFVKVENNKYCGILLRSANVLLVSNLLACDKESQPARLT